ncbi:GGDEF domain-containing protein [Ferriphaselus sp. R-1]|uniref:GGDEF domain-containing protein n=1 Tax=Ferriphaselus sp. R-1 TaxID=1485544 RepID=UPI00054CF4A5|nr:GGDEF domain-containing protein [Ferriphaselus sp. R-1]
MNNPSEIARETLKLLASRKLAATPANYTLVYQEISGEPNETGGAETILIGIAQRLIKESPKTSPIGKSLKQALSSRDWTRCQNELQQFLFPSGDQAKQAPPWSDLIRDLLRQLELTHKGITLARKKEGVEMVLARFGTDPVILSEKLQGLVRSWSGGGAESQEVVAHEQPPAVADITTSPEVLATATPDAVSAPATAPNALLSQLAELLAQTLESNRQFHPELSVEIDALIGQVRTTHDHDQVNQLAGKLRHFWLRMETHSGDKIKVQEGLIRLLRLLVENVSELVADDKWLRGQIGMFQHIIANPIDKRVIADAERSLRDAIIKQGLLQQSLTDAKSTLKTLMSSFIDRLGELTDSTGEYHTKMENYSQKIGGADNLVELGHILDDIMQDTRTIQESALRSRDELLTTRKQASEAERRIRELEDELEHVSELVREDQLTGALNRRGLDEIMEREYKRADRNPAPISIALLDVDNFKRLNDTLGHQAGDQALIHLATVIKDALRPSDSVGRYGGEEFIIVLPDTALEEGIATISRLQRELTKRYFMHNNERQLITFSAGIALRGDGETADDTIARADKAMYLAKQTGKNRVVAAD